MACYLQLFFTVLCIFIAFIDRHAYSTVLKHALDQISKYGYSEFIRNQKEQIITDINSWNVLPPNNRYIFYRRLI